MRLRSRFLPLCFAALAFVVASSSIRAHAQTASYGQTSDELQHDILDALPSQLALTTVSTLAVVGGTFYVTYAPIQHTKEASGGVVLYAAAVPLFMGLPLAPSVAAGTAQWMGRRQHVQGSYWRAWGFSLLGTAVGGGAGMAIAGFALRTQHAYGFALCTLGLASVGGSIGAVRGYNSGARSRLDKLTKHLSPSVSTTSDKRGALFTVSGTF